MRGTNPLAKMIPEKKGPSDEPTWVWGTVQSDGSSVLVDHDEEPLASTPDSLVALAAGDRVYVQIFQRRAVVLGKKVV